MPDKMCQKCKVAKPTDEFHKCSNGSMGLASYCKVCMSVAGKQWADKNKQKVSEYNRLWRAKNRDYHNQRYRERYHKDLEKHRGYYRKARVRRSIDVRCRKFGITAEQYWTMFADQEGLCAICKKAPKLWWSFNVDHCHTTGKIRGLLCGPCNKSIGILGDTVDGVMRAVTYLRESASKDLGIAADTRLSRQEWVKNRRAKTDRAAAALVKEIEMRSAHQPSLFDDIEDAADPVPLADAPQ